MSLRMLIDARHPEETRVAVVNGQRIEEFDFEAADRKQLKGNIYLAKVTRVEPSLQAAFVDYGGNRHGFLAFSEIHPDYYQIPREDRERLLREEAELAAEEDHHDDAGDHRDDHDDEDDGHDDPHSHGHGHAHRAAPDNGDDHGDQADAPHPDDEVAETGGHSDEPSDALRRRRQSLRRRYKIQEVIHRRQVLLVQVVKEERGNKGAALTTYLSLAGRYCVLMPNTAHGGGISRKISNPADRKRLKSIMSDLRLPNGMGAILRTAGLKRSHAEIRRDFDYLTRLWDEVREKTLGSVAPALIHQDSDLIKRAIRDIYSRDIEQILVEGPHGYEAAHRFMSLLMPSHAPKVTEYKDVVPLFQRFGVEGQLASLYQPVVQLKSGGYLVINPTEALVSIDINSGRSTREYGIEETATKTNLEAAEEIARQLRLRDMAGLVVIDFIDMEHGGNVRKVERCMKEALKNDRARIQLGRISAFGLMEMSRQRLRTGILEASTHICPMCDGTGSVRTVPSAALSALRALEAEALRGRASEFTLRAGNDVAVYILNRKRLELNELEERYGVTIVTVPDEELSGPNFAIDAAGAPPAKRIEMAPVPTPVKIVDDPDETAAAGGDDEDDGEGRGEGRGEARDGRSRRGRGRRRGGGRGEGAPADAAPADEVSEDADEAAADTGGEDERQDNIPGETVAEGIARRKRRRRRGRRGGRREGGETTDSPAAGDAAAEADDATPDKDATLAPEVVAKAAPKRGRRRRGKAGDAGADAGAEAGADAGPVVDAEPAESVAVADAIPGIAELFDGEAPTKPKRSRRRKADDAVPVAEAPAVEAPVAEAPEPVAETAKPKRPRRRKAGEDAAGPAMVDTAVADQPAETAEEPAPTAANDANGSADPSQPPRKGWWQRTFG